MNANRSKHPWKFFLPEKSSKSLAIFSSLLVCLILNSAQAQVTTAPKSEGEPVDPAREKQKEAYFKVLKEGKPTTIVQQETRPVAAEPVDPSREQQKAEYAAGKNTQTQNDLPEALPEWKDTGNHEADEAAYREAVNGWIKRNGHLYESEELEFLKKPILKLEERQQNLNNN